MSSAIRATNRTPGTPIPSCKLDSRIKACINIDAPGFGASDLAGLEQPLLWIRLQKAGGVPAEYLKTADCGLPIAD